MVKFLLYFFISTTLFANTFTTNCISCHQDTKQLKLFMAKYTLKYSSERKIKRALFKFLKYPTSNKSIMPYSFIIKSGFKENSILNDSELKKAINSYYNIYKVNNFIK